MERGDTSTVVVAVARLMRVTSLAFWIWSVGWAYAAAQSKPADGAPTMLWSVEVLQDLGGSRNGGAPLVRDSNRAGVAFLDEKTLLAYELDLDKGQLSSRQNPSESSPFRLHASVLDAGSGKLILAKDWGTRVHESSIHVVSGGVLVRTGEILRFLTRDLAEVRNVALEMGDSGNRPSHWDLRIISVSPSGKSVMVNRIDQKLNASRFDVLDGNSLKPRYSWDESPALYNSYSISDTGIAAADFHQGAVIHTQFGSRKWEPILNKPKEGGIGVPTMIDDSRLLLQISNRLSVLSTNGRSDVLYDLGKTETADQRIAVSRNGRFAAIALNSLEIKKHIFSEASVRVSPKQIVVYDLSLRKRVLTLEIAPFPKNDYDFALSPDGSKLAILNDRIPRSGAFVMPQASFCPVLTGIN